MGEKSPFFLYSLNFIPLMDIVIVSQFTDIQLQSIPVFSLFDLWVDMLITNDQLNKEINRRGLPPKVEFEKYKKL